MDPQTKKEIITEISSTAAKTIKQAVKNSLKRDLTQEILDKTINETIKRIKSFTISEFKSKGKKTRYEVYNSIFEKIDDAFNSIEKKTHGKMPRKTDER